MKHAVFCSGAALLSLAAIGCSPEPTEISGVSSFEIHIVRVNGEEPPTLDEPLPANIGLFDEAWDFEIVALDPFGKPVDFDGYGRALVEPGAVTGISGEGSVGRNIAFVDGKAAGTALVTAVYGPSRLWVEDVGYVPVPPDAPPRCADGADDDNDGLVDYPADPGCAFADDDTETPGTFAAGVSAPVHYALPRIADIQGTGTETPYPFEGIRVNTEGRRVIVTRVASDGFYATDIDGPEGASNSIFAFNFSTPSGMRVCDQLVYFSGTLSEFFGFTELSFPSYDVTFIKAGEGECPVPAAAVIDTTVANDPVKMESLESALVRLEGYKIAKYLASGHPVNDKGQLTNDFKKGTNCDLNDDGQIDYENQDEASCSNACSDNPDCSEWTSFQARQTYKLAKDGVQILVQTSTVPDFDPLAHLDEVLTALTGTMRNFSGGSLNWTIETRCPDDLVCAFEKGCAEKILPSTQACVRLRTTDDPDESTN